jgi:hypothetical protein
MLVRRRCVPIPPAAAAATRPVPAGGRAWLEDAGDGAYWGGSDLVFEGP